MARYYYFIQCRHCGKIYGFKYDSVVSEQVVNKLFSCNCGKREFEIVRIVENRYGKVALK